MPFSVIVPISAAFCRNPNNKSAFYRANNLSKLLKARGFTYMTLFSFAGLMSIDLDSIKVSNAYLIHRRLLPVN